MKLFISYARVDKSVCLQIVNTLSGHNVWYDQRLYAGQHWWREILRRLEWCDVFVYLISKDSLASHYCQKELEIALQLDRSILPVVIDSKITLPSHLDELQYIDMSETLDAENVSMLHNSILMASTNHYAHPQPLVKQKLTTDEIKPLMDTSDEMIGQAASAFEQGDYDQAIMLFKQAQANGFKSRFINVDRMLKAAEQAIEDQIRLREAKREYTQIMKLFKYPKMREFACEAFQKFHAAYPDYDPNNLKQHCMPELDTHRAVTSILENDILPMLKWCEIPEGVIQTSTANSVGDRSVRVPTFWMSKYPITNEQFDHFVQDSAGYANPRWWQFSDYAIAWFEEHTEPLESRYQGADRPRENVNWYEAIAFTRWLSHNCDANITLPRVAQWQRAAQGDDDRFYPWGNIFNAAHCNTHESQIKCTTSVTQYENGKSPFGIYDMAGNVWEWCLDRANPEEGSYDYKRAVLGGSFVSPGDRAQVSFRYYLNPEVRYSSIGFRVIYLPNSANMNP